MRNVRRETYFGDDYRPRRGRRDNFGRGGGRYYSTGDKGRGLHLLGGRRDGEGPHLDEGCNTVQNENPGQRYYKNRYDRFSQTNETSKTKMFSSKKELLEYVNEIGETGQRVEIFKIEDDLYKVVVY